MPMCANDYLINQVVRTAWNRSDVLTVTDCGAINNMIVESMYASSAEEVSIFFFFLKKKWLIVCFWNLRILFSSLTHFF